MMKVGALGERGQGASLAIHPVQAAVGARAPERHYRAAAADRERRPASPLGIVRQALSDGRRCTDDVCPGEVIGLRAQQPLAQREQVVAADADGASAANSRRASLPSIDPSKTAISSGSTLSARYRK